MLQVLAKNEINRKTFTFLFLNILCSCFDFNNVFRWSERHLTCFSRQKLEVRKWKSKTNSNQYRKTFDFRPQGFCGYCSSFELFARPERDELIKSVCLSVATALFQGSKIIDPAARSCFQALKEVKQN